MMKKLCLYFCLLVFSIEEVFPEKPIVALASKTNIQLDAIRILKRTGFKEVAAGTYLKKSLLFLVDPASPKRVQAICTKIEAPYFLLNINDIKEIQVSNEKSSSYRISSKKVSLVFSDSSYHLVPFYLGVKAMFAWGDDRHEYLTPFSSWHESLLKNGFQSWLGRKGVYRLAIDHESIQTSHSGRYTLVVVVKDEKISFIGLLDERVDSDLGALMGDYKFIEGSDGRNVRSYSLRSGPLKFSVDEEGNYVFHEINSNQELELPLKENQRFIQREEGFVVGGINSSESIRHLRRLTGLFVEEIEKRARPGGESRSGFLTETERFISVLVKDNEFVFSRGFTHQQLAKPLFYVMNLFYFLFLRDEEGYKYSGAIKFFYNGQKYALEAYGAGQYLTLQNSIFDDGLHSGMDFKVTNLTNGKSIVFSEMLPYYIWRYGFYLGNVQAISPFVLFGEKERTFRLNPNDIIDVFGLSSSSSFPDALDVLMEVAL